MPELKRCPFCGNDGFLWKAFGGWKVSCVKDCVSMPTRFDASFMNEQDAVKYWNTRADSKPSWDNAPEWAQWLALDKSGLLFWFEDMPILGKDNNNLNGHWMSIRRTRLASLVFDSVPYLEQRPVKKK